MAHQTGRAHRCRRLRWGWIKVFQPRGPTTSSRYSPRGGRYTTCVRCEVCGRHSQIWIDRHARLAGGTNDSVVAQLALYIGAVKTASTPRPGKPFARRLTSPSQSVRRLDLVCAGPGPHTNFTSQDGPGCPARPCAAARYARSKQRRRREGLASDIGGKGISPGPAQWHCHIE